MSERTSKSYTEFLLSLLPPGNIAKSFGSNIVLIFKLIANELSRIDAAACGLIEEADPRTTQALFEDWEEFAGLPDPCSPTDLTKEERRNRLIQKLTSQGGQSRAFYEQMALDLGYDVSIRQHKPFTCGISQCIAPSDDVFIAIMPPEHRFVWSVTVHGDRLTWFKCGVSEVGVDPMLKITAATDLECIFQKLKQSHTHLNFIYEEA